MDVYREKKPKRCWDQHNKVHHICWETQDNIRMVTFSPYKSKFINSINTSDRMISNAINNNKKKRVIKIFFECNQQQQQQKKVS